MKLIFTAKNLLLKQGLLKGLFLLSTALLISACGVSKLKPDFSEFSFYSLNPDTGYYCKGYDSDPAKKYCKSIIPTNFNHLETRVIENIYQQQVTEPNRVISLINIILSGENIDYKPVLLENGAYKLPITQQTDTVWDVIVKIDGLTHDDDDD